MIFWPVQGFLDMQQSSNFPCHLTMFWPDEPTAEWFEVTASEILRNKFREGCLKVLALTGQGWVLGGMWARYVYEVQLLLSHGGKMNGTKVCMMGSSVHD